MGSSRLGLIDDLLFAALFAFATIGACGVVLTAHTIDEASIATGLTVGLIAFFMKPLGRFQAARVPARPKVPYDLSSWKAKGWMWLEPRDSLVAACRNGLIATLAVAPIMAFIALGLRRFEWDRLLTGCVLVGVTVAAIGAFTVIQARRNRKIAS